MNQIGKQVLFVVAIIAMLGVQARSAEMVEGTLGQKIDLHMNRLAGLDFSGGVLAVKDGKLVIAKGYGFANEKLHKPFTTDTVFPIGSITKPFTATAVMTLVMQGKIGVDDPIAKYFDDVPADKQGMTIHHLLTHSSGLPDVMGGDFDTSATKDWLYQKAMSSKLQWKPGKKYDYSNLGYSLLGMLIEKVSGQPYEQYLRDQVLKPAGMMKTGYVLPQFKPDELAVCYQDGEPWGTMFDQPMLDDGPCWNLRCNGGLHTTLNDMYKFYAALEDNRILSKEAQEKSLTAHVNEGYGDSWYGYGWTKFITSRNTTMWTHNGGDGGGYSAMLIRFVDENAMVFAVSSASDFIADSVDQALSGYLFNARVKLPPESIKLDPTTLSTFKGTYQLDSGDQIIVSQKKDRLAMTPKGQDAMLMLSTGRKPSRSKLQQYNQKTATMIENSAKGDYSLVAKAFQGMIPADQIEKMESQLWRDLIAEHGAFRGVTILGSAPFRMGMIATTARFDFERGSAFIRYAWEGNHLGGIRPLDGPPVFTFYPKSPEEFFSFKLGSPDSVEIKFVQSTSDQPQMLTVRRGNKDISAKKIQ